MIFEKLKYRLVVFICIFFGTVNLLSSYAQNVISVRKEEKKEVVSFKGIYYSAPYTLSTGVPGEPPSDFQRMYVYIDEYNRIYVFHSNKKVSKVVEKFLKNPNKMTEEIGTIEFVEADIYIETKTYSNSSVLYRYAGYIDTSNTFYLEYKAKFGRKASLNLLFHKFIN